jgi:hypothetical protein
MPCESTTSLQCLSAAPVPRSAYIPGLLKSQQTIHRHRTSGSCPICASLGALGNISLSYLCYQTLASHTATVLTDVDLASSLLLLLRLNCHIWNPLSPIWFPRVCDHRLKPTPFGPLHKTFDISQPKYSLNINSFSLQSHAYFSTQFVVNTQSSAFFFSQERVALQLTAPATGTFTCQPHSTITTGKWIAEHNERRIAPKTRSAVVSDPSDRSLDSQPYS